MQLAYCYLVTVYAKLTLYSLVCRLCWLAYNNILHFPFRRTSIMKLFYFSAFQPFLAFGPFLKCTEACGPVIYFLVFMNVFGIWSVFEIHRGMWPDYIFSRFLMSVFCICWLQIVLAFCPFSKCTGGMWSGHIFSRFHARPQKSYQSKFQKCCPTNIKKTRQEKVFLSSN